jgi:hypothetical protein
VLHVAFDVTGPAGHAVHTGGTGAATGAGGMGAMGGIAGLGWVGGILPPPGAGMVAAHASAALVVTVLLRRGEALLWAAARLLRAAARLLPARPRPPVAGVPRTVLPAVTPPAPATPDARRGGASQRRGPPAGRTASLALPGLPPAR